MSEAEITDEYHKKAEEELWFKLDHHLPSKNAEAIRGDIDEFLQEVSSIGTLESLYHFRSQRQAAMGHIKGLKPRTEPAMLYDLCVDEYCKQMGYLITHPATAKPLVTGKKHSSMLRILPATKLPDSTLLENGYHAVARESAAKGLENTERHHADEVYIRLSQFNKDASKVKTLGKLKTLIEERFSAKENKKHDHVTVDFEQRMIKYWAGVVECIVAHEKEFQHNRKKLTESQRLSVLTNKIKEPKSLPILDRIKLEKATPPKHRTH